MGEKDSQIFMACESDSEDSCVRVWIRLPPRISDPEGMCMCVPHGTVVAQTAHIDGASVPPADIKSPAPSHRCCRPG